jgi:5-methylcytosine-specific restriction enzyme A
MTRLEFSATIKRKAFERANGKCETCAAPISPGKVEYDHRLPCALGGRADLANCQAICIPCHKEKTAADIGRVRKADRQRNRHVGAVTPKAKIPSPPKAEKVRRFDRTPLPPRPMFISGATE